MKKKGILVALYCALVRHFRTQSLDGEYFSLHPNLHFNERNDKEFPLLFCREERTVIKRDLIKSSIRAIESCLMENALFYASLETRVIN